ITGRRRKPYIPSARGPCCCYLPCRCNLRQRPLTQLTSRDVANLAISERAPHEFRKIGGTVPVFATRACFCGLFAKTPAIFESENRQLHRNRSPTQGRILVHITPRRGHPLDWITPLSGAVGNFALTLFYDFFRAPVPCLTRFPHYLWGD